MNTNTLKNSRGSEKDITDVPVESLPADTSKPIRLGFWVLVVGFGAFLAWAAWAPLDEGVAAPAVVAIETKRKPVQHLIGGVIKTVHVKEGQWVKDGDVLLELDPATTQASFGAIRQNYLAQRAAESRLVSEQLEKGAIEFHPDLVLAAADPVVKHLMASQTQLFQARRAALQAEMSAALDSIKGLEAQIEGQSAMLVHRQQQAKLQSDQIANVRELAAQGYAPRNQLLQLEQGQAELRGSISDLQGSIARARQGIAETRQRMLARRQEYHKEESAQLADVRREVDANREKLQAITDELNRTKIRAPADGQVVASAVSSVGGVVGPGQKLMDIVPKGETLVIDAKLPPHVIDRVQVGLPAEVRFSSFAHAPQLVLDAKVASVSADAVSEQAGVQVITYYLARVQVTPEGLKQLGGRVMQPGMPAEVLVKTGERSMLTYLLHPLTKRIAAAMKEE